MSEETNLYRCEWCGKLTDTITLKKDPEIQVCEKCFQDFLAGHPEGKPDEDQDKGDK
jgi:hypothetical protein